MTRRTARAARARRWRWWVVPLAVVAYCAPYAAGVVVWRLTSGAPGPADWTGGVLNRNTRTDTGICVRLQAGEHRRVTGTPHPFGPPTWDRIALDIRVEVTGHGRTGSTPAIDMKTVCTFP